MLEFSKKIISSFLLVLILLTFTMVADAVVITSGDTAQAIDENSGAGQVIYTVSSNDSHDIVQQGAISQEFIDNGDNTFTVQFFVDASIASDFDQGVQGIGFAIGYTSDDGELSFQGAEHTSNAFFALDNIVNNEILFQAFYTENEVYAPADKTYYDASSDTPILEATFSVSDASQVNLITVGQVSLMHSVATNASKYTVTAVSSYAIDAENDVTYSLAAGSDSALSIDSSTGAVSLSDDPNFEVQSVYNFTVVANDAASNQASQSVSLSINNVDESAPTITSGDAVSIVENTGVNQVVYTATSTDSDDVSGGVTYSLAEGSDVALSIDADSGVVTLAKNPDYEMQNEFNFTVVATDAAGNASDSQQVTVSIADEMVYTFTHWSSDVVLDAAMVDGSPHKELSTSEVTQSITAGDALDALKLSVGLSVDSYQESDNAEMFQQLSGDVNSDGRVNSSDAHVILLRAARVEGSFESEWKFFEMHQDNDSASFAGYVLGDVDGSWASAEDAPVINLEESAVANQVIYNFDATSSTVVAQGGGLNVDLDAGEVSLAEDANYEHQSSYSFTLVNRFSGKEQNFTVSVLNEDEVAPEIVSSTTVSLAENTGAGQVVYVAVANDSDDFSGGVTYSLADGSDPALSIDPETGEVTLNDNPDYEIKSSYSFLIYVIDITGSVIEIQTVSVKINKVFDSDQFTSPLVIDIAENIGSNQVIYSAQAESDTEGGVVYSLLENDQQQGAIKQTFIDNNDGTYTMQLAIEDSVAEENNNSISCMDFTLEFNPYEVEDINADDLNFVGASIFSLVVNDSYYDQIRLGVIFDVFGSNQPLDISNERVFLEINFSLNTGISSAQFDVSRLGICSVTQDYVDLTPTSATFGSFSSSPFVINPNTGEVTLLDDPMYEAQSEYTFTVVATDAAGSTSQTVTVNIVRNLLDIDENGVADALTDGLTIMKYAFGIRNESIFGESIAADSTLIYSQIESKLNLNSLVFDIDGDGHLSPLSDGLLILRYLFGLRGDALISGVVSEYAERNSYDEIINYLDTLKN